MKKIWLFFITMILTATCQAQVAPLREQARVVDELLAERYESLLPGLMARSGIDMWILVSREYNEDPVLKTMLPAEWLNARRRTILVFYRDGKSGRVEKLAVARYGVGQQVSAAWDMQKFPNQWDALAEIVRSRNPQKIGLNTSRHFGHADGIDHTDFLELTQALPARFRQRVVSAEPLAIGWLETRTEREMQIYAGLVQATHQIIAEGFSTAAIQPGVTTTADLVWWFRQKIRDLGYETWFQPSVDIQRAGPGGAATDPELIMAGDLLHVDIGISHLRLNTDIQQHAYVLKPGERAVPAGLVQAFQNAQRLQDILTGQFAAGRSGNQMLAAALAQARAEGIEPSIYSHPIGYHGHAAGPAIGMWDQQGGVPGTGDQLLRPKTAWSIELNATTPVPEWQKKVRIMLEEDAYFDAAGVRYINGSQDEIRLIPGG